MNKNTKVIITVLAVLVAAVAGYAYASPWITLENLRDDAMAGKADNMQDYVDFPAVRDSLKGQIQSVMMKNLQSEEMKDNPFSGLAMMMAGSMIDSLVNTMASPNGFVNIVQGKDVRDKATTQAAATPAQDLASAPAPTKAFNGAINYDGFNRVIVKAKDAKDGDPYIVMKRDGLFSWKVVDLQVGAMPEQ